MLDGKWGGLNWPHDQRVLLSLLERFRHKERVAVCELGVDKGHTGNRIVQFLLHIGVASVNYFGIDDLSLARYEPAVDHAPQLEYDCMKFVEGDRRALAALGEFDFVFIDACHCAECVYEDSIAASLAVSTGGLMVFHDTSLMVQYPNCQRPNAWQHYVSGVPLRPLGVVEGISAARSSWRGNWVLVEQSGDRLDWGGIRAYQRVA